MDVGLRNGAPKQDLTGVIERINTLGAKLASTNVLLG
jgi:hypothetical protein